MSKIKKFNGFINEQVTEDIVLTMNDVRSIKTNLGGRDNDPVKNYSWGEDQTLIVPKPEKYNKSIDWNGKKILILDLFTTSTNERFKYGSQLGYAVLIDDTLTYLVSIYEPHGSQLLPDRNLLIVHGHEEITLLWLDNGDFNTTHTR